MAVRRLRTTRSASKGTGVDIQLPSLKRVVKRTFTLVTAGDTDQDLASVDTPAQKYVNLDQGDSGSVTKALITAVHIYAKTAAGTLIAAVVGLSTATLGTGTVVVTPAAITGLTAAGTIKAMTVIANIVVTTGKLYVYETTDSGNAGTIEVVVEYIDLSDLA